MNFDSLTWAGAESEYNNQLLLIRFREIPRAFPRSKYPERVNVFWEMGEVDENGLPTEDEFTRLETFENRLVDAVEPDAQSILVAALTCNGEKEFVFYTTEVSEFLQRLTNMPQEEERYPITIQKYDDPDWGYFDSVLPT
jgi:Family of unknown function (DUF695)